MKLNCDLGEGLDNVDQAIMPFIDQANIACGGHAGTKESMLACIYAAQKYDVEIGAHPSYPAPENFGRCSMDMPLVELKKSIVQQVLLLIHYCHTHSAKVIYIKPHGALYNDMSKKMPLFKALLSCIGEVARANYGLPLSLMVPANLPQKFVVLAAEASIPLVFEGFADRAYTATGGLVSRLEPNAVYTDELSVLSQARQFVELHGVMSVSQQWLPMSVDSLCVHGDTEGAVHLVKAISTYLKSV